MSSSVSSFFNALPATHARLLPDAFDLGGPRLTGTADYHVRDQSYQITAGGDNMWNGSDEAHFVGRKCMGGVILRARASFVGTGGHAHRKLGLSFRVGPDGAAPHVTAVLHADGLVSLQYRRTEGARTHEQICPQTGADWLQLERRGRTFVMSVAHHGQPWVETVLEMGPELPPEVWAGLFVCSHDADRLESAVFTNVRLFRPAPADLRPYRDYLSSDLELLDVDSGHARVIAHLAGELQSPNWSPDGREIDLNREGLIHRLHLDDGRMTLVDTGRADRNNNDHVRSADGRQIGLSHHSAEHNGLSLLYTVPSEGGTPALVTPLGPSYLHGWSPDGSHLIYTARREETGTALNLYRIAAQGGPETRLSDGPGLDDGSEYSPDGKWIYFNSDRSGAMKIWRMAPDGTGVEQITHDALNDWFPHVSPDGSALVFLTYPSDVPARDHPFYRHVYLRRCALDPLTGAVGAPSIIAYLHGGQGTFNVPPWSPDSLCVAYVSNGALD